MGPCHATDACVDVECKFDRHKLAFGSTRPTETELGLTSVFGDKEVQNVDGIGACVPPIE